jgi:uncharacterized membrane protein (UPF0182 family)
MIWTYRRSWIKFSTRRRTTSGSQRFSFSWAPVDAKKDLSVIRGEIYFGELTEDRVYVHTTEKEFDFPQGQANAETVYQGSGGILLSNLWRKLVIAREFDGPRLFNARHR